MASRLTRYLDSIMARDPAPRSRLEILLYPGVWAVAFHRVAHWLYEGQLFFLARAVNHFARFLTAIDIHPGATIGRNLFIDHGFTVIGETANIGDDVTIYQNVTLGGTNPANGIPGKRHPTLESGVIVGAGAQVLGPIIIGERARIGANSVVTSAVAAETIVVGMPARPLTPSRAEGDRADAAQPSASQKTSPADEAADGDHGAFIPYGTPCSEAFDPATQQWELLRCEVEQLRARVAHLMEADARTQGPRTKDTRANASDITTK